MHGRERHGDEDLPMTLERAAVLFLMTCALGSVASTIIYWAMLARFFALLKAHAPDVYVQLNRPRVFMRRSLADELNLARFLLRKEYQAIPHQPTVLAAAACRMHLLVGIGLIAAGAATLGAGALIFNGNGA